MVPDGIYRLEDTRISINQIGIKTIGSKPLANANYIPNRIYERVSNLIIESEHNDLGMIEVFVKAH